MKKLALLVFMSLSVSGCSATDALGVLTGGGPNVAANVQAGKTNTQTVGTTQVTDQKIIRPKARTIEQSSGPTRVRTERVEVVNVQEGPDFWLIAALMLLAGFVIPSPSEISRGIRSQWSALRERRTA